MILLDQAGAGTSGATILRPVRAQKSFVEHFWAQSVRSSSDGPSWRVIPEANPNLIFVASRESRSIRIRCHVVGPRSCFTDVRMTDRILTCGVRLRPGALAVLTRLPASDFTDRSVPVEDVFGARGTLLTEQLAESRSPLAAISRLSDFLSHHWTQQKHIAHLPLGEHVRVEDMARQAGLPLRTLRARLIHHVGLSPKRALRVERLHRALRRSQHGPVSWAQIAVNCGFADQAHLIREFQDLLGESPTAWIRRSRLPISSRQGTLPHSRV